MRRLAMVLVASAALVASSAAVALAFKVPHTRWSGRGKIRTTMKFSDKSKVKTSRDFNGTLDTTFTNVTLGFTDLPTSAPPMVMNFAFDTEKVKNTSITADAKKTPAAQQAQQTILDDLAKDAEAAGGTLVGAAVVDPATGKSSLKYVIVDKNFQQTKGAAKFTAKGTVTSGPRMGQTFTMTTAIDFAGTRTQ